MPEIKGQGNLEELESRIIQKIRRYSSDVVLRFVQYALEDSQKQTSVGHQFFPADTEGLPSFIAAAIASFSIRFSNPYCRKRSFGWRELAELTQLAEDYLLTDPICFDKELCQGFYSSNPIFLVLRLVAAQFPFEVNTFGCFAQPLILFGEMPQVVSRRKDVPNFDFRGEFQRTTRVSLEDFVDVGFVIWTASKMTNGFTRGYFSKARSQGIRLPDDETICRILDQVVADPQRFRDIYEELKEKDRRFRMYDFNPLFQFPVVRPWKHSKGLAIDQDRMVAPVPDLVSYRFSTGIFYQMFNKYKESFSRYFGYLFEAYVGRILQEATSFENLFSEDDIRHTYPAKKGKVPDWVVVEGDTAILIECKATRFSRAALATGAESAIDTSLEQVLKGLIQLSEFQEAAKAKLPGLELLRRCTDLIPVLVTFEPLYLINRKFFCEHINGLLAKKGVNDFPWQILSIKEIEVLQPHLTTGVCLKEVVRKLKDRTFPDVLEEILALTGQTYKDSFLYSLNEEIYRRLGF